MSKHSTIVMVALVALTLAFVIAITLIQTESRALASTNGMTFTVNSPADVPDASPGDGRCETVVNNNVCTLRAAIQEANALPGADIIAIGALTVTLTRVGYDDSAFNGDLDISGTLTIDGAGANSSVIDGNGNTTKSRVFHILPGAAVTIRDVFVRGGKAVSAPLPYGGGIAIASGAALTLTNAVIEYDTAQFGGGIYNDGALTLSGFVFVGYSQAQQGGGIYNAGTLNGSNTYLFDNNASVAGGALFNTDTNGRASLSNAFIYNNFASGGVVSTTGGAIVNFAALTLTNASVQYNRADLGGNIYNGVNASVVLSDTLVQGGHANDSGGGIVNFGIVRALNSLFALNTAGNRGGGIYNGGAGGGTVYLTNSTLSANRSDGEGGGIYNYSGSTSLFNVTVAANIADDDNNDTSNGGGIKQFGGTLTLQNTIVANNFHRVGIFPFSVADDCKGTLTSQGYNLVEDTTACTLGGTSTGNIIGQDPKLGPLQDNGGSTSTHALLPGSPAINAGNPSGCTDPFGAVLLFDQRGSRRPAGGRCDIGAYEAWLNVWLPLVVR